MDILNNNLLLKRLTIVKQISLIIVFISTFAAAQTGGGERVFSFLNFSTSARQTALGGSILTLTDDVNQASWNPATINETMSGKLAFNYANYLKDVNYFSTNYAYHINEHAGTLHTGITYLNYGTFIAADENGVETGTFKAFDMAWSLGYAYQIPHSHFFVGTNFKLIHSVIEQYHSLGLALDIGGLYYNPEKAYKIGFVIRNAGLQITQYTDTKEPVPLLIQLGASYRLEHVPIRLYGTLNDLQTWKIAFANPSDSTADFEGNVSLNEPTFVNNLVRHVVIGAELFPESGFSLRFGFNFKRANELKLHSIRSFSGINAGFGIKIRRFKLNYAFSKYHPIADTHTFSLVFDL